MRASLFFFFLVSIGLSPVLKAQVTPGDSLFTLGDKYYLEAKFEQAATLFDEAGRYYLQEGDSAGWFKAITRKSGAFVEFGNVREALKLLLPISSHIPEKIPPASVSSFHESLGKIYRELEQYEQSILHYNTAIKLAEQEDDFQALATLNNNISYAYLYSGDYEKALSYQMKAKEMYEKLGDDYRLSFVLNGIYLTLTELNLFKQADPYIRRSLAIRQKIGNPRLLDIANHNMASNFGSLNQPDSAIIYYQKSLEISRRLGNPFDITQTLINIGDLYLKSGDNESALLYYNEALEYNRETKRPISIADNLSKIAAVAVKQKDYEAAKSFNKEALGLLKGAKNPRRRADVLLAMADIEMLQKNYDAAEAYIQESSNIAEETDITGFKAKVHEAFGKLYAAKGDPERSLAEYKKAVTFSNHQSYFSRLKSIMNLARAYRKVGSQQAFTLAEDALLMIDSTRTNIAGLTFRGGNFRKYAAFYNEVASWYITERNDAAKAFELIEAAKARVLLDRMAEAENNMFDRLDEPTLIQKQQLLKKIDKNHRLLNQATSQQEQEQLRNELKNLEFKYEVFLNEIRQKLPEWKNFEYPTPIKLTEAQNMVDANTALLEYAFAGNSLVRLMVTPKNISASVIDSIQSKPAKLYIEEETRSFREAIINRQDHIDAQHLYEQLIPSEKEMRQNKTSALTVIADGALSFLPFEALNNSKGYLIEQYNVKYLPSASIYPLIKSPHRSTELDLLALAGSGFEQTPAYSTQNRSQTNYASLPSTIMEVDSIAAYFEKPRTLKNEEVTEAALNSFDLSQFQFLHFATHAVIDEYNPSQSGLILSKKSEVESLFGEDGRLNSNEIAELRLNADLVTLSACNTGMGSLMTGEGLLGLQRSFLTAGASSVMVSMWNIYDRSTAVFMADFYKRMLTYKKADYGMWEQALNWAGMHRHPMFDYKTKALRETKLAMINHPYYHHPVYWASFILVGK